jgi:hypothetical protein
MASEKNSGEQCGFWASFSVPKNNKSYKWTSVVLVLLLLGAGGFVTWFLMKNAAHKLAGGAKYVRLSDNTASYGADPKSEQEQGFFASEEELAKADPSLKKELLKTSAGSAAEAGRGTSMTSAPAARGHGGGGAAGGTAEGDVSATGTGGGAAAHGSGLEARLSARESGLSGTKGAPLSKTSGLEPARGANTASVQSAQADTDKPGPTGKGPKPSVLESLKSAFKANLYGARIASQDSAREWVAKTFDANQDTRLSLEYDEHMKAKLDRVNPNSIPKYLRDQSLDAASAKSLGASDVDKPGFDKDGTKDALKGDKKYQDEKDSQDLAKALFNPLGPFGSSGGNPAAAGGDPSDPGNTKAVTTPDDGTGIYDDPNDAQSLNDIALEDYIATEGYGAECGCTLEAPCCCLPPNSLNQQCPMYGPFLPDDPCAAGMYATTTGDFPAGDALVAQYQADVSNMTEQYQSVAGTAP